MNGYFSELNKNKYLTVVPANESNKKKKLRKHEELWSKIRNLIESITKNSYDYDEKHKKLKLKIHNATIVVRASFTKITNIIPR